MNEDLDIGKFAGAYTNGYNAQLMERLNTELTKPSNPQFPRVSLVWQQYADQRYHTVRNDTVRIIAMEKYMTTAINAEGVPIMVSEKPPNARGAVVMAPRTAAHTVGRWYDAKLTKRSLATVISGL